MLTAQSAVAANETVTTSMSGEGGTYRVDGILIAYQRQHPDSPSLGELANVQFELGLSGQGFVAPGPDRQSKTLTVAKIGQQSENRFSAGAIRHITTSLLAHFNSMGLAGIWVGVHPQDVDPGNGKDLRPGQQGILRVLVQTAVVGKVRTLARGDRIEESDAVNNPAYAWMLQDSPVKPGEGWTESDLLNKEELNDYARFLSRYIGRRVDLAISPLEDVPGSVSLDYIVYEQKPRTIWAQLSNTGTGQTADWRVSFGYQDTQFTGNDDKLDLVYSSAGFDKTHYLNASWEVPVMTNRHIRLRLQGGYNEYTASDVGFGDLNFRGRSSNVGVMMVHNFRQNGPLFIDAVYGISLEDTKVDNQVVGRTGDGRFLFPQIGLQFQRYSRFGSTTGDINLRVNVMGIDDENLDALGRTLAEDYFTLLSWNFTHNFYLERLFDRTNTATTLAHEIALSLAGQTSLGRRLPPNYQRTIGGLYTVRGYPEAIIAGDTVGYGTFEYRFHVPQVLGISSNPGDDPFKERPFRFRPQHALGVTDWDLVLKAFADFGWASAAEPLPFEFDETLVGAGFGFDLRYRSNFFLTVDWGFALKDTQYEAVTSGSSRVGISASVRF